MRYMIYWDDLVLWWPLSNLSVSIPRCISEPFFMFLFHFMERNLCYFTQKSLLGVGWHCNYRVSSRSRPWDLRWSWYWDDLYMTWTWPGHDLDAYFYSPCFWAFSEISLKREPEDFSWIIWTNPERKLVDFSWHVRVEFWRDLVAIALKRINQFFTWVITL